MKVADLALLIAVFLLSVTLMKMLGFFEISKESKEHETDSNDSGFEKVKTLKDLEKWINEKMENRSEITIQNVSTVIAEKFTDFEKSIETIKEQTTELQNALNEKLIPKTTKKL